MSMSNCCDAWLTILDQRGDIRVVVCEFYMDNLVSARAKLEPSMFDRAYAIGGKLKIFI